MSFMLLLILIRRLPRRYFRHDLRCRRHYFHTLFSSLSIFTIDVLRYFARFSDIDAMRLSYYAALCRQR